MELQASGGGPENRPHDGSVRFPLLPAQPWGLPVTDTCYVLSFAIVMLNTSLHNHNVRDKPTAERVVTLNRGIHEGRDPPEELLRNL